MATDFACHPTRVDASMKSLSAHRKPPEPKRHHFIPRVLLRNFADPQQRLWFNRPEFAPGETRLTHLDNLFVEGQLNTIVELDGSVNKSAEAQFGHIETTAGEFLPAVISAVREGAQPVLSNQAWDFWHHFFSAQWRRTPPYLESITDSVELDATMRRDIATLLAKGAIPAEYGERLKDPAVFAQQRKNALILARARNPGDELLAFLRTLGLAIYRIPATTKRQFVLGDVSIARPFSGAPMFMPIAPDIALGMTDRRGEVVVVPLSDRDDVRKMNSSMRRQSAVIASGDRAMLESVLRPRR